jgi:hypothetical protein
VFIDGESKQKSDGQSTSGSETSEDKKTLVIRTDINGHNSGRTYIHRTKYPEDLQMWLREISSAVQKRKVDHAFEKQIQGKSNFYRLCHAARYQTRIWFESFPFQVIIGCVIVASFAVDVGEAEVLPEKNSESDKLFRSLDGIFTFIFLFELAANLFAHSELFFRAFFADSWNVLDFVVVLVSLLTLILSSNESSKASDKIKIFRLIKIFRIIRLFRRLKSLNRIVSALGSSIIPVLNSFLILLLVTCIYATLATYLFGRGTPKNSKHFTKFSVSLFSMFQVMSGVSGVSGVSGDSLDIRVLKSYMSFLIRAFMSQTGHVRRLVGRNNHAISLRQQGRLRE